MNSILRFNNLKEMVLMADLIKLGNSLVTSTSQTPQSDLDIFSLSASIGKVVFAFRIRKGLTQAELSTKADVGLKTIYRLEGGDQGIGTGTLEKVLYALEVTQEEFISAMAELGKKNNRERAFAY